MKKYFAIICLLGFALSGHYTHAADIYSFCDQPNTDPNDSSQYLSGISPACTNPYSVPITITAVRLLTAQGSGYSSNHNFTAGMGTSTTGTSTFSICSATFNSSTVAPLSNGQLFTFLFPNGCTVPAYTTVFFNTAATTSTYFYYVGLSEGVPLSTWFINLVAGWNYSTSTASGGTTTINYLGPNYHDWLLVMGFFSFIIAFIFLRYLFGPIIWYNTNSE